MSMRDVDISLPKNSSYKQGYAPRLINMYNVKTYLQYASKRSEHRKIFSIKTNKKTKKYITKLTPQYCSVIHKHKLGSIQLSTLFFFFGRINLHILKLRAVLYASTNRLRYIKVIRTREDHRLLIELTSEAQTNIL